MDKVRKQEYPGMIGGGRRSIKGQKYALHPHWVNLMTDGKEAVWLLFRINTRLNQVYLIKESFEQHWGYHSPTWSRKFFDQPNLI